jgi:hypothetical protein
VADVEQLGIVITLQGEAEADRALAGIAKAGEAAEQSTRRLTGAQQELIARSERVATAGYSIDVANRKAVDSYLREVAQVRALAREMGVLAEVEQRTAQSAQTAASLLATETAALKALKVETGLAAASQAELGAATGLTKGGLNSLRASVQSFAASMLGAAPGVAQFTGALGTMAIGSGLMIGVLAAWRPRRSRGTSSRSRCGSRRRSTRRHQGLEDVRRERDEGPAGEMGAALPAGHQDLQKDLDTIARLQAAHRQPPRVRESGRRRGGASAVGAGLGRDATALSRPAGQRAGERSEEARLEKEGR